MKRFLIAVDGFYADPDGIRRRALAMTYSHPENVTGWRTRCYQPRGIKERIERMFSVRIPYWEDDLDAIEACNGVFFHEIDRVGNVFNRAVMFPGGFYHSATRHFGSGLRDGRIYQSFHFPVELGRR